MGIVLPIWHCYASVNWEEEIESELTPPMEFGTFFEWATKGAPMYPKVYLMKFRDLFGDWGWEMTFGVRNSGSDDGIEPFQSCMESVMQFSGSPFHPSLLHIRPLFSHFGGGRGGGMSPGKKL